MAPDIKNAHRKFLIVLGILTGIVGMTALVIEPGLVILVLLGALALWLLFWAFIGCCALFIWIFQ